MFYYFELRSYFYSRERSLSLTISTNEITNLWDVTRRNVRYRLKTLQDLGYLEYHPGNGRGNNSKILYCHQFQQDVSDYVERSTKSESYGKIFELFELPIPKDWIWMRIGHSYEIQKELKTICNNTIQYYANLDSIDSLNPFLQWNQHETIIITYMGDSLLLYDGMSRSIKPNIVHHWESLDSYSKWIFHIRKGIKFHNNLELTAYDIAWSLNQYNINMQSPSWVLNTIKEIKCVSKYKIEIELNQPIYLFDMYLAWTSLVICQKNTGTDNTIPVMSGAYKLLDVNKDKIILESNRQYFKGQALIDKVEINNTHLYKKGSNIVPGNSRTENFNYKKILHTGVCMLLFNFWKKSIIQNKYFREAMKYILNFGNMKKYFQDDIFEEATTFSSRNRTILKKEPGDIVNLLKKSGYKGEQLIIHCLSPKICGSSDANFIDYLINESKKYNINISFKIVSNNDFNKGESRIHADMFYGPDTPYCNYWTSFLALFNDHNCLPYWFLGKNKLSYINNILDINFICESEADLEDKIEKVESYIRSENLIIFLFHRYLRFDIDNQLREFNMSQLGYPIIKDMWIDE